MFQELMPLINKRPLTLTVAALNGGLIRVNVVPQALDGDGKVNDKLVYSNKEIDKVPESAIHALTTPLSLTGTPEEIDAELAQKLTEFTASHVQLQKGLEKAQTEIADALKAIEERNKAKTKPKATTSAAKPEGKEEKKDEPLPLLWCTPTNGAQGTAAAVSADDAVHSETGAGTADSSHVRPADEEDSGEVIEEEEGSQS